MASLPEARRFLKTIVFLLDLIGFVAVFAAVLSLRLSELSHLSFFSGPMLTFAFLNWMCLYLLSLYQFNVETPLWRQPLQALVAAFVAGCMIVLVAYVSGAIAFTGVIGRGALIGTQFCFGVWAGAHRFILSKWLRRVSQRTRWLVIGNEKYLSEFFSDLQSDSPANRLTGYFGYLTEDGQPIAAALVPAASSGEPIAGASAAAAPLTYRHLGSWDQIQSLQHKNWTGVIIGTDQGLPDKMIESLMHIRLEGTRVYDLADFYELVWYKVPAFYLRHSWVAMSQGFQLLHNPIGLRLKKAMDFLLASFLLILASPILLLTMLAIRIESRGSVVFKQTRVGENGQLFTVYKLRSMRTDAEKDGARWAMKNDSRITRVGSFIRATRIDELPQLVNVTRGEMSFIGPRPERPEFTGMLEKEIPFYGLRHILRPGVTGWAQVMYPYGASVEDAREKLQFDLYYIKNYSLLLDAAIIFKTIRVVLFGKGR